MIISPEVIVDGIYKVPYIDQIGFLLQMLLASAVTIPALGIIYFKWIKSKVKELLSKWRKNAKRD